MAPLKGLVRVCEKAVLEYQRLLQRLVDILRAQIRCATIVTHCPRHYHHQCFLVCLFVCVCACVFVCYMCDVVWFVAGAAQLRGLGGGGGCGASRGGDGPDPGSRYGEKLIQQLMS